MSFARSLFTVSSLTIVSRVGGFIRDTLTAIFLGAGALADAYFVAQRLPNLFRSLFAEGAFSAAFVPLYTAEEQAQGKTAAQLFASEALAALLAILIPFSALAIIFMPWVIRVMAPGFENDPEKFANTVLFARVTFPYLTLISVTSLQGGVLNAHNRFGPAAATPIALNIVLILTMLVAYLMKWEMGFALSWGMMIGGLVQMLWLMISCHKAGLSIPLIVPRFTVRTVRLFKQIGPGAIGAGATQINLLISTILASLLPAGAVSYLYYADRLNQLPLGIVGIAIATTLLPVLSRHVAAGDEETVQHYMSRAIEFCFLLGLPAAIGLAIAAKPIISTLFEHGAFTSADTIETTKTLQAYTIGIPAFLLVKVFASNFFARHNTSTPVKIAMVAMASNLLFAVLLMKPFGHVGIAFATSLATWVNFSLLFWTLKKAGMPLADKTLLYRLPRLFSCAVGMALSCYGLVWLTNSWFTNGTLSIKLAGIMIIICASSLFFALLLQVTGAMRWREMLGILKH